MRNVNVSFYLSLGSNLGDRLFFLKEALQALQKNEQIKLSQVSSIYETEPVGNTEQDPFLNIVVQGECSLTVEELLETTQSIENQLGRTREVHWGPRTIDIDILLYNNIQLHTENLVLPHPRMTERAFVLTPLIEIAPDCSIPGENRKASQFLALLEGKGVLRWKIKFKDGESGFELFEN